MKTDSLQFSRFLKAIAISCVLSGTLPALAQGSWSKGDRVFGQAGDGNWYPGRITSLNSSRYQVKFDANRDSVTTYKVAPYNWRTGSKLQCTLDGGGNAYFRGKIINTLDNIAFQVRFDRGNVQNRRISSCRYDGTPYVAAPKKIQQYNPPPRGNSRKFNAGEEVLAYHTGFWYPATITAVRIENYDIQFKGGLKANHRESSISRLAWRQGSQVQCNSKTVANKNYFAARVEAINNKDIWVIYNNGARETLEHGRCRSK
ncbi:MAG: hypothetical protein HRU05_15635 [Oceanospirillaceae bacterium]|nr:hypothetical protein [Oceanospirillaceae bacterium]